MKAGEVIVPVCRSDLIVRRLKEPADLAAQTLINYVTEPYAWSDWLAGAGVSELKPLGNLKFEQMYFALQAALEGLGVVLVPLFLTIDDIISGRLSAPFGLLAARRRQYFAYSSRSNPIIESFYDCLLRAGRDTERSIAGWAAGAGCGDFPRD